MFFAQYKKYIFSSLALTCLTLCFSFYSGQAQLPGLDPPLFSSTADMPGGPVRTKMSIIQHYSTWTDCDGTNGQTEYRWRTHFSYAGLVNYTNCIQVNCCECWEPNSRWMDVLDTEIFDVTSLDRFATRLKIHGKVTDTNYPNAYFTHGFWEADHVGSQFPCGVALADETGLPDGDDGICYLMAEDGFLANRHLCDLPPGAGTHLGSVLYGGTSELWPNVCSSSSSVYGTRVAADYTPPAPEGVSNAISCESYITLDVDDSMCRNYSGNIWNELYDYYIETSPGSSQFELACNDCDAEASIFFAEVGTYEVRVYAVSAANTDKVSISYVSGTVTKTDPNASLEVEYPEDVVYEIAPIGKNDIVIPSWYTTNPDTTGYPVLINGCADAYTFSDDTTWLCPTSYEINRTWSVLDVNGNELETGVQTISYLDVFAPRIYPFLLSPQITGCDPTVAITDYYANLGFDYPYSESPVTIPYDEENYGGPAINMEVDSAVVSVTYWDTIFIESCPDNRPFVRRTWVIQDECGNDGDPGVALYFIIPESEPTLTCEGNIGPIEGCNSSVITEENTGFAFSETPVLVPHENFPGTIEGCSFGLELFYLDEITDNSCPNPILQVTRTWEMRMWAGCGAVVSSCTQLITVEDNTASSITCAPDIGPIEGCDENAITASTAGFAYSENLVNVPINEFPGEVTSNSSCAASTTASYQDAIISSGCPNPVLTVQRTWTISDACGNSTTCTQNITVADNTAPVVSCPPAVTGLACFSVPVPAVNNVADFVARGGTVQEACSADNEIVVSAADDQGVFDLDYCSNDPADRTITRTYTITDVCGNTTNCTRAFIYDQSIIPPTVQAPEDLTIACASDANPSLDDATFTVDCGLNGSQDISDPVVNGDPDCPGTTYTYTYTNTDACGRVATDEQVFTIENEAPTITCPADMTVTCFSDITVSANDAIITVACTLGSNINVSAPVQSGDDDCPGTTYTYTYTVTDNCGRSASCQQIFTIENEGPVITCAPDLTVECFADIIVSPDDAIVNTSCTLGFNTVVNGPIQLGDDDCNGTQYIYKYVTTDACGRVASCQRTFTIENSAPILECPADQIVTCAEDIEIDIANLGVTAACNLGYFVYVRNPIIENGIPGCNGTTYTYEYVVTDDCGRVSTCTQTFTIENSAPQVSVLPGATVDCASDIEVNLNDVTVNTDCSSGWYNVNLIYPPVINGAPDCPGTTYTYTYRVKDNCSRIVEVERVFIIGQTANPSITAPADQTVNCLASVNANPDHAIANISCGQGNHHVQLSGPEINGALDCDGTTYTYTYTIIDACGRSASDEQVFTVLNSGPQLVCPGDLQINDCDHGGYLEIINAWLESVSAIGGCAESLTITNDYNPDNLGMCYWNAINTVTFTATDNCGRSSSCSANIIIIDNEAPLIYDGAQDQYEVCNGNTQQLFSEWLQNYGYAGAVDGCSDENITWSTTPSNPVLNCTGNQSINVTFCAEDACGNRSCTDATFYTFNPGGSLVAQDEPIAPNTGFEVFQNNPNPFVENTTINFKLSESSSIQLQVFDISGRLLLTTRQEFSKGLNQIDLNRSDLAGSGILFYRLSNGEQTITKKMMLLSK